MSTLKFREEAIMVTWDGGCGMRGMGWEDLRSKCRVQDSRFEIATGMCDLWCAIWDKEKDDVYPMFRIQSVKNNNVNKLAIFFL